MAHIWAKLNNFEKLIQTLNEKYFNQFFGEQSKLHLPTDDSAIKYKTKLATQHRFQYDLL